MKTKEEILEETMCCTITEEADLDDPRNFYFEYDDVLKAMEEYAQQLSTNKQRPHICPVCCGRQYVMPEFYDGYSSTALNTELCRTCGGIGIVWEPGRKEESK